MYSFKITLSSNKNKIDFSLLICSVNAHYESYVNRPFSKEKNTHVIFERIALDK